MGEYNSLFIIWCLIIISPSFQGCRASRQFHVYRHLYYKQESPFFNNERYSGKFLHITDIHIDPDYLESSDPTSFCHRFSPNPILNLSGKFGLLSSPCDTPYPLTNATFEFMRNNFKDIDFVIYTGDTVRHDKDSKFKRTEEQVLFAHKTVIEYIQKYFDLSRIKFIPTLGNNDEFEHDKLAEGPNELLSNITQIWAPLGLNLTSTFLIGGYYRQDIYEKLTILSLNSMYFYKSNSLIPDCNETNSAGALQLEWLERELNDARNEKRRVYISQHVPPLDYSDKKSYTPACFDEYIQLLGKYSDIIHGHFTGHTNKDTLTFIYNDDNADEYSMFALNGTYFPSSLPTKNILLTLTNAPSIKPTHNPAIRLYHYSTMMWNFGALRDYTQYYINLTEANEIGKATWRVEYRASETYNMESLSPKAWTRVLQGFKIPDSDTWRLYVKHVTVSGP